ncbi:hypothetical protein ACFW04_013652 [Cataglyphis niger]
MKTEIKDRVYEEQLDQINENISEDERNIRLLKLLPALCIPTMKIHKDMRNIKPTITESLNSFILSVNSPADLEHNIERQRNRAAVLNLILSINAYYVCIKYYIKLKVLLKLSTYAASIWLLIQKCLYKMTTEHDVSNNTVTAIEMALCKM